MPTKKRRKPAKSARTLRLSVLLDGPLVKKFLNQARLVGDSPAAHAALLIDNLVPVDQLTDHAKRGRAVKALAKLIASLPGVEKSMGVSQPDESFWWIKFSIDRKHPLAWHVIQWLGWVMNYYSLEEKFPIKFCSVSPPPDLNGGPEFLGWIIEASVPFHDPRPATAALKSILPRNPRSATEWRAFDTEE